MSVLSYTELLYLMRNKLRIKRAYLKDNRFARNRLSGEIAPLQPRPLYVRPDIRSTALLTRHAEMPSSAIE